MFPEIIPGSDLRSKCEHSQTSITIPPFWLHASYRNGSVYVTLIWQYILILILGVKSLLSDISLSRLKNYRLWNYKQECLGYKTLVIIAEVYTTCVTDATLKPALLVRIIHLFA